MFTQAVQEYGVEDTYTFPTESLHEKTDLAQVLVCIRALGVEVSFKTPGLGIHEKCLGSVIIPIHWGLNFIIEVEAQNQIRFLECT